MDNRRREDEEPLTPTSRHSNVFSDDYEVLDVADGFRPNADGNDDDDERHPLHTAAAHYASNPVMTFSPGPLSRSSTRKSRTSDNPFVSPEDNTSITRTPSTRSSNYAPGIAARTFSSASSSQYAATNSPRPGVAGPSHPYTMYPQGTIIRSPSAATASTSTTRPARQTSLRNGPQHPYGMYTQGIADSEDDDDEERAANPVPVGFGLGQTYRRVRGPEGEEQDIIGEYGHAEQLPPYTRYPEDGPEKAPLLAVPESMHTRAPIEGTDPGMPLMHTQMSAQSRQSMTDASQLLEQESPLLGDTESIGGSEETSSSLGKKSWKQKTWKERRRTKVLCGIPFGWILVAMGCIGFIFAVLIGSLVGYMAGTHNKAAAAAAAAAATTYTTSLYDASLIATPTNAPATGSFALTLGSPQATQTDCLVNPSQRVAWDCNLVGKPAVVMSVGLPPTPTPSNGAFLFYASDDLNISYGAQYQFLQTPFSNLIPVQDNDDVTLGPAFFFQQTYNKIVVLPENTFPVPGLTKRQGPPRLEPQWNANWQTRKQKARPGDKPWFCFFNNTAIEGFLYVQKPASLNVTSASVTSSMPIITSTSSVAAASTAQATSSPSPTAMPSSVPAWVSSKMAQAQGDHDSASTAIQARDADGDNGAWAGLYPYPFIVKLEERRVPNNTIQPYCQQYQILDNEGYGVVVDPSGAPIRFTLDESIAPGAYKRSAAPAAGGCHCQWMHGVP